MQDVFRLRAADVFRVLEIDQVPSMQRADGTSAATSVHRTRCGSRPTRAGLGELCTRISRCGDLDTLVRVTVDGLAELLGHDHSLLLLLDEGGQRLFTLASHGYEAEGVGSEVAARGGPDRARRRTGLGGALRQPPADATYSTNDPPLVRGVG